MLFRSGGSGGPPAGSGGINKRHRGSPRNPAKNPAGQLRSSNSAEAHMHSKPRLEKTKAIVGRTKSLPVKPTQQTSVVLPQQRMYIFFNLFANELCKSVMYNHLSECSPEKDCCCC